MPKIEISYSDLCHLIGRQISVKELEERGALYAKGEIEEHVGDQLKVDVKDTNRPDLWSTEGIAREIRGRYVRGGLPQYSVKKSDLIVNVDPKLKNIRPKTVCAVVRGLNITPHVLSQMIQLQEKVSVTFGRNRKEVAIGVYDLHKITPPIKFTTVKPDGIKFAPLDFDRKLTPAEILKLHPKGKEFGHLLKGCPEYPIFIDAAGEVLSIPPIINSNYTGKITEKTKDIFIECSGFEFRFLIPALNVIVAALADRGGQLESVKIVYSGKTINTPDLKPKETFVDIDYVKKISGLNLNAEQICKLLEQARYKTILSGKKIQLLYPAYRQDIMHQVDVIEDIIISYGYNNISPEILKLATTGSADKMELFSKTITELMVGFGAQEILSYNLTNKENLFTKMGLEAQNVVEIENAISSTWAVFRNQLLSGLLEFLAANKHVNYPQKIFEIGDVVLLDPGAETRTQDRRKLAWAMSNNVVGYEEAIAVLDGLMSTLGLGYKLKRTSHPSFIQGRAADIFVAEQNIGIVGEISPAILERWELENPTVCFELDLVPIYKKLMK